MNLRAPQVSVCIPVFNGESYIAQALESVLSQTFLDFEVIITDNCSTDKTLQIIKNISQKNPRMKVFSNEENLGIVGNFNRCLDLANAKYVKFLCADDLLLPTCLEQMVRPLEVDPLISMVVCGRNFINNVGINKSCSAYSSTNLRINGHDVIQKCFYGANFIGEPSAVLFRRDLVRRHFRVDLNHLMDLEMWFYLLENGDMYSIAAPLCSIRQHDEQMTVENIASGDLLKNNATLYETYINKPYLKTGFLRELTRKIYFANRIWLCRKAITAEERKFFLQKYSSPLFYKVFTPYFSILRSVILLFRG